MFVAASPHSLTLLSLLCKWTLSSLRCLIVDAPLLLFLRICGYLIYVRAFNLFSARLDFVRLHLARHSGLMLPHFDEKGVLRCDH